MKGESKFNLFLKILIIVLLLFNSSGALFGGYSLMVDPSGGGIELPLSMIENTFFGNYFIPGIILFVCNGLFGLLVIGLVLINTSRAPFFVIVQGGILLVWLVTQIIIIQVFFYLQFVMAAVGILLILIGYLLDHSKR